MRGVYVQPLGREKTRHAAKGRGKDSALSIGVKFCHTFGNSKSCQFLVSLIGWLSTLVTNQLVANFLACLKIGKPIAISGTDDVA